MLTASFGLNPVQPFGCLKANWLINFVTYHQGVLDSRCHIISYNNLRQVLSDTIHQREPEAEKSTTASVNVNIFHQL